MNNNWQEFKDSGLLWWVNRSLHLFGWAIIVVEDDQGNIVNAYPRRVEYRGFAEDVEDKGFVKLTEYISDNIDKIREEVLDDGSDINPF